MLIATQVFAWASSTTDLFDRGVAAFRDHEYVEALRLFEQAQSEGLEGNKLYYNLGVIYYKLNRFADANHAFLNISGDPEMEALARYNLGLVALKQNKTKQAVEWFNKARDISKSDKVTRLCVEQLRRLGYSVPHNGRKSPPGFGLIRGSLGYDDNAILQADTLTTSAANKGDGYFEFLAYGNKQIAQIGNKVVQIEGSLFDIHYSDLGDYDVDDLFTGAILENQLDSWTLNTELSQDVTFVGGNGLDRSATLQIAGRRNLSEDDRLQLRYRLSRIDDLDAVYSYLAGWSHQAQVESTLYAGQQQIRLTYQFEYNNRADLQVPLFTSYSPTRHTLKIRDTFPIIERLKAGVELRYRYSHYHDASEQPDGSFIARADKRYRAIAKLVYKVSKNTELTGEYTRTDNHSNIAIEQYKRNQYQINLSYLW